MDIENVIVERNCKSGSFDLVGWMEGKRERENRLGIGIVVDFDLVVVDDDLCDKITFV